MATVRVFIKGYEGRYSVTDDGEVYSHIRDKVLVSHPNHKGYLHIQLRNSVGKRKGHYIHRLVMEAFTVNTYNLETINHLDEDKLNNNLSNLEWLSRRDNSRYSCKTYKFINPNNELIQIKHLKDFCSQNNLHLGHMVGVSKGHRSHHKQWRHAA